MIDALKADLAAEMADVPIKPESHSRLALRAMSTLRRREVLSLDPQLPMPHGSLVILTGQQGIGKSLGTAEIAARVTRHGHGVVFVADEDSAEAVIHPRLEAASADLSMVFIIEPVRRDDLAGVALPRDTADVAQLARKHDLRLVVIDPWSNHLDNVDVDKGAVRAAIMPLARAARDGGFVVLLVAHPVKRSTGDPLSDVAHASAITQIARSAFTMLVDPDRGPPDPRRNPHRILCHVKSNLMPWGDTVTFSIEDVLLPAADGQPEMHTARIVRTGTSELSFHDAQSRLRQEAPTDAGGQARTATGRARTWLREFLAEAGPTLRPVVVDAAERAGHAERTLNRVARDLVSSSRPEGATADQPVTWSLPDPGVASKSHEDHRAKPAEPAKPRAYVGDMATDNGSASLAGLAKQDDPPRELAEPAGQRAHFGESNGRLPEDGPLMRRASVPVGVEE